MEEKNQGKILDLRKKLEDGKNLINQEGKIVGSIDRKFVFQNPEILQKPVNFNFQNSAKQWGDEFFTKNGEKDCAENEKTDKKLKKRNFFLFNLLTSFFSIFLSFVFVGSGIIGAMQLKIWLPKLFYENYEKNSDSEKVFIPSFLFEEIDKSKENPEVLKWQTDHIILRYENIEETAEEGLGVPPTITFLDFENQMNRFEREKNESILLYDFLKQLFFKDDSKKSFSIIFVGGYDGHYRAFKILKEKKIKATFFIPAEKVGKPGFLTWDEVKEISNAGYEIGATGNEFIRLGGMKVSDQNSQIKESRKILTQKLNKEILVFYYPFGSYTADTLALVRNHEFVGGVGNGEVSTQELNKSFELHSIYNKLYFG